MNKKSKTMKKVYRKYIYDVTVKELLLTIRCLMRQKICFYMVMYNLVIAPEHCCDQIELVYKRVNCISDL